MRYSSLLLFCGVALGASLGVVACGAEDSGAPLPRDRSQSDDGTPAADDPSQPSSTGGTSPAPASGSTDAGTDAGSSDVDADAAPASTTAFTGAPVYTAPAVTPRNINEGPHNAAPGRSTATNGDPAGAACSNAGCHTGGRAFLFGGTVYTTAGVPAPNVEIRVRDANGKGISVFSNAQGNFYVDKGQNTLTGAVLTGARSVASTHPMITPLTEATVANCNACHTGVAGQTARIFVK